MAGQKMYSTGILTTARGVIKCTGAISVNTATGAPTTSIPNGSATILAGKMAKAVGTNGVVTLTMPEKFAKCENISFECTDPGAAGVYAALTTDYNPAAGTLTFSILSKTATAVTSGTYTVYYGCDFALGM